MKSLENEVDKVCESYLSDVDLIDIEIQDYINSFANIENVLSDEYIAFNKKNNELLLEDLQNVKISVDDKENQDKLIVEKNNNEKEVNKIKNILDAIKNYSER